MRIDELTVGALVIVLGGCGDVAVEAPTPAPAQPERDEGPPSPGAPLAEQPEPVAPGIAGPNAALDAPYVQRVDLSCWGHSATLLADSRVLVIGACQSGGVAFDAGVFDATTGRLQRIPIEVPVVGHASTALPDGGVLVSGGVRSDTLDPHMAQPRSACVVFDPGRGAFFGASPMDAPRAWHAAIVTPDGTMVSGGRTTHYGAPDQSLSGSVELYDLDSETWVMRSPLGSPRQRHGAVALSDGDVLIAGGLGTDNFGETSLPPSERFDHASDVWMANGDPATSWGGSHPAGLLIATSTGPMFIRGNEAARYTQGEWQADPAPAGFWASAGSWIHSLDQVFVTGLGYYGGLVAAGLDSRGESWADRVVPQVNGPTSTPPITHTVLDSGRHLLIVGDEGSAVIELI